VWEPPHQPAREYLVETDQKIVFDRCHLMKYLSRAVDTVRKKENRALAAAGDDSLFEPSTSGCTQRRTSPITARTDSPFFVAPDLQTARAGAATESLSQAWSYTCRGSGEKRWKAW